MTEPSKLAPAFAKAKAWTEQFRVPVVVEVILERVTNISIWTEIDKITEFEEILDLPPEPARR